MLIKVDDPRNIIWELVNPIDVDWIHVEGRVWYRRDKPALSTVAIWIDGNFIPVRDNYSGAGDYYLQQALYWLEEMGLIRDLER